MTTSHEELLDELRPAAFAIAYRMLGSVAEAEDVVQETLLRVHGALEEGQRISSPRAYAATVATRLAIDQLRSARARRESYVGEWLPEPLVADSADDPARHAEMADSLSLAFLVLLESLSPEQRAVLLLHDVFDYRFDEIARDSRQVRGQHPPAGDPRAPARKGEASALRRVPRAARRAGATLLCGRRAGGSHGAGRAARGGRRAARRRRWQGAGACPLAARPQPCGTHAFGLDAAGRPHSGREHPPGRGQRPARRAAAGRTTTKCSASGRSTSPTDRCRASARS